MKISELIEELNRYGEDFDLMIEAPNNESLLQVAITTLVNGRVVIIAAPGNP